VEILEENLSVALLSLACFAYFFYWGQNKVAYQILLAPMGVLAPRSVHARPPARPPAPIDTSRNFPVQVFAE
jgi:hypothetical protein